MVLYTQNDVDASQFIAGWEGWGCGMAGLCSDIDIKHCAYHKYNHTKIKWKCIE